MVKNLPANAGDIGDMGSIPEPVRSPGGGNDNLPSIFLPGKPYGQKSPESPEGYSPQSHKESYTTEHTCVYEHTHTHTHK